MCAIVDANVASEVFGKNRPPAGEKFFKWLNTGNRRLVIGGKLRKELYKTDLRTWARRGRNFARIIEVDESQVIERTKELTRNHSCESNDPHVIALAQISGARLLYSNDALLQRDFKNNDLIDNPDGKVYSTRITGKFTKARRKLLNTPGLCSTP